MYDLIKESVRSCGHRLMRFFWLEVWMFRSDVFAILSLRIRLRCPWLALQRSKILLSQDFQDYSFWFDLLSQFLAYLGIDNGICCETRSRQIGRKYMSESNSSLLHQVARKAMCLKGTMGSEPRISYACTWKALAGWKWEGLKKHPQESRYVVFRFAMADQEQQHSE